MKTVVHFQDVVKTLSGIPSLRINDLRIYERESFAFFGLPHEHIEIRKCALHQALFVFLQAQPQLFAGGI